MTSRHRMMVGCGAGLIALSTLGCQTDGLDPSTRPEALLRRMASCDDLRGELEHRVVETLVDSRYGRWGWRFDAPGMAEDGAAAPSEGGASPPSDFTGTNVQEVGVDEVDIVKPDVDGTHLFVAQDRGFHVVKSWPIDEVELLSSMELDGWTRGLFLVDASTAVVFESLDASQAGLSGRDGWRPIVRVRTLDVSDRTNPVTTRIVDLDGYLVDARMIDGDVTFVVNQWMEVPSALWDSVWDETQGWPDYPSGNLSSEAYEAALEQAKAEARDLIRPAVRAHLQRQPLSELLPQWRTEEGAALTSVHDCTDIYAPDAVSQLSMLSVVTYGVADGSLGAAGLLSDGWTVYASRSNLYVAQSSRWWWGWSDETVSHVHKFRLGGGEPTYAGSGEVQGWLYDQFAMSEHNGFLRVVTTDFRSWWGWPDDEDVEAPANNVFILEDDDAGSLDVVGHVGGIAPNEQIFAARMMGDKGYIVTFEMVDPLFVLDLSDPYDPQVLGELKIPGYSAYLHPLGESHLIGVGMAGLDTGELTGLAVNLFDVSDPTDPKLETDHEVSHQGGWSWSEALWDHHAFTYHRDTLTIPAASSYWDDVSGEWTGFSGTISFRVVAGDPITELGRVDHAALVDESACLWDRWYGHSWLRSGAAEESGAEGSSPGGGAGESMCSWDYGYWYARVRRSLYIEDNLFTLSDYGLKVNDLSDPSVEHNRVVFYPAPVP